MVIPDMVLFVNGIPLVVMAAKSPTLMDVWKAQAVRQLLRYQEAGPERHGAGAPELFYYNLLCVAHCGAAAVFAGVGAPENVYFGWKSVLPYSEDEVRQRFGVEPQGQAELIVGLLSPSTLMDILRDYVVYEPDHGRLVKKLPRYQQYRAVGAALQRILTGNKPEERGGRLRDSFVELVRHSGFSVAINGPLGNGRHPGNANMRFDGLTAQDILGALQPRVAASTGAACTSGIPEPSYVLRALGLSATQAESSVRFSFGRLTTDEDIHEAARLVTNAAESSSLATA